MEAIETKWNANWTASLALSACWLLLPSCTPTQIDDRAPVSDTRLVDAAHGPESWLTHGGDDTEQRFSKLSAIGEHSVDRLGLAWSFDLATERGVEATPLVVDGVMYVSAPFSVVHALYAATGALHGTYDLNIDRNWVRNVCCGFANRGVAVYSDKIYVGTLDGRLVAIDRESGRLAWEVENVKGDLPYSITGAPRVVEGKVVIGRESKQSQGEAPSTPPASSPSSSKSRSTASRRRNAIPTFLAIPRRSSRTPSAVSAQVPRSFTHTVGTLPSRAKKRRRTISPHGNLF